MDMKRRGTNNKANEQRKTVHGSERNTISMEYRGIRLTYGMSIDYLAMPGIVRQTAQRGTTLISVRPDGSMEIEPIPCAVSE